MYLPQKALTLQEVSEYRGRLLGEGVPDAFGRRSEQVAAEEVAVGRETSIDEFYAPDEWR